MSFKDFLQTNNPDIDKNTINFYYNQMQPDYKQKRNSYSELDIA